MSIPVLQISEPDPSVTTPVATAVELSSPVEALPEGQTASWETGVSVTEALEEISNFLPLVQEKTAFHAGYPLNLAYDYTALFQLLEFSVLNMGDPYVDSNYGSHSRRFEKQVLSCFAELYKILEDDFWGYVTSGGTECNLYGIFLGREVYPNGLLYFSADTHYSIAKAANLFNMESVIVRSLPNGEIDYDHLQELLEQNRHRPAILSLNIGTTMKGAIDDVDRVLSILEHLNIEKHYIHCDAALSGMFLPLLSGAPQVDFTKAIGSISVSAYKFLGAPIPCGVILTRRQFVKAVEVNIEYIGSKDTTILGARNGHTPIFLWYALKTKGFEGIKHEAEVCLKNAKYLFDRLNCIQHPCLLNDFSTTVYFQRPPEQVAKKWQLAVQGDWAHIVVMQNINKWKIDTFLHDLLEVCPLVE
jgi:histidine decarboxylase